MKPEAWYIASQDNFFGPLAPAAARRGREQHQHPERHDGAHAALWLLHLAGLVRQAAVLGWHRVAGLQLELQPAPCRRPTSSPSSSSTTSRTSAVGARFPTAGTAPTRSTPRCRSCGATTASRPAPTCGSMGVDTVSDTVDGRHVHLRPSLHQQQRRRRPRTGQRAARRAGVGLCAVRRWPVRVVHQVLRRLHPGRLAGEPEAHRELRRAVRARRRPARKSRTARRWLSTKPWSVR